MINDNAINMFTNINQCNRIFMACRSVSSMTSVFDRSSLE
jgi:hypothetical protein